MSKYIISGGPCSGKTTILNALKKEGYNCFDEIARQVISEEQNLKSNNLPWIDNLAFSKIVLARMLQDIKNAESLKLCFFDRGIPDLIGYMYFYKNDVPNSFIETIKNAPYDKKVFFIEPWKEIYKNDQERTETFEEAESISNSLINSYKKFGFEITLIGKTTVENRINLIKKHITNSYS